MEQFMKKRQVKVRTDAATRMITEYWILQMELEATNKKLRESQELIFKVSSTLRNKRHADLLLDNIVEELNGGKEQRQKGLLMDILDEEE
jgi:hypothetical protein